MQNTQLQNVLRTFTRVDVKRFTEYLASPYFNKKKTLYAFWMRLQKYYPTFEISDAAKKTIFSKTFKRPFSDVYYRNICSDLLSETMHFICLSTMLDDTLEMMRYDIISMINRNLTGIAEKQLKVSYKKISPQSNSYKDVLKARIWQDDLTKILLIRKTRSKHETAVDEMITENLVHKVMDYAFVKCAISCMNAYRASLIGKVTYDRSLSDKLLHTFESGLCSDDIFVRAYYLNIRLTVYEDESCYAELKNIIITDTVISLANDKENLLVSVLSFVTSRLDTPNKYWMQEMYELYDYRLSNKLWKLHGSLAYTSLYNAVFNSLQLGKTNYAESVVKKYAQETPAAIRNDITNLCTAWVSFYKKEFHKAHELLVSVKTVNLVLKYELRTLQCMIYLENGEFLTLLSYIDSFKHFINYNKNVVDTVTLQKKLSFCNMLSQLTKLKMDPNKKLSTRLRADIEAQNFVLKEWMLQHI